MGSHQDNILKRYGALLDQINQLIYTDKILKGGLFEGLEPPIEYAIIQKASAISRLPRSGFGCPFLFHCIICKMHYIYQ